jgi:uncharacterized protein
MSQRSCSDCSMCCRLLEIAADRAPEAAHKAREWCRHCVRPGCGIYAQRPSLCREFACQWLLDERLGPEWFPPVSGMILVFTDSTLYVVVDPARADAWRAQPYRHDIERMASWGRKAPEPFEVQLSGAYQFATG